MRGGWLVAAAAAMLAGCAMVPTPYVVVVEHELRPADEAPSDEESAPSFAVVASDEGEEGEAPAAPDDDSVYEAFPEPEWAWATEHLRKGADFGTPFIGPHVYPGISIGTSVTADHVDRRDEVEFLNTLDASLYWLDLRVPMIQKVDGERSDLKLLIDLKIPFALPGSDDWMAVLWGAAISESKPGLADNGRFELLYGHGGEIVSLQLRGGYGYQQTFPWTTLRRGLLYGGLLGLNLGPVQPQVEVDGIRYLERDDEIVLLPGLRFYPASKPTLRIGLGGVIVLTRGDAGEHRRYGASLQLGYSFL